ncbi:MAG: hypothetical protein Q6370_008640 [Candidatus Sigynarchaeota archaeon]
MFPNSNVGKYRYHVQYIEEPINTEPFMNRIDVLAKIEMIGEFA